MLIIRLETRSFRKTLHFLFCRKRFDVTILKTTNQIQGTFIFIVYLCYEIIIFFFLSMTTNVLSLDFLNSCEVSEVL